jgi:hypothetical protein
MRIAIAIESWTGVLVLVPHRVARVERRSLLASDASKPGIVVM